MHRLIAAAALAATAVASVNGAVAFQWKADLRRVLLSPGALAPVLASPCVALATPVVAPAAQSPAGPSGGDGKVGQGGSASQPCTTASVRGHCKTGTKCMSAACTKSDGTQGRCVTKVVRKKSPLLVQCPGFAYESWSCDDACAPVPPWAILLGGALAGARVAARRRTTPRA